VGVAGIDTTVEEWADIIHAWHCFGSFLPEAHEASDRIGEFVRWV
jgi:hypothetical protein